MIAPLTVALAAAAFPSNAAAAVAHTVVPGESLWSIASANNLTTRALAPAPFPSNAAPPVARTVVPGGSRWGLASANNLTTRPLAAYNGLPADGGVVLGGTVMVPTAAEGSSAMAAAGLTPTNPPATG